MTTISYRKLAPTDIDALRTLQDIYRSVFKEQMPQLNDAYLNKLLNGETAVFFIAEQGATILGGATAYHLPSLYGERDELYIYDIAVTEAFQRIGIGSGLLAFIKDYCKQNQIKDLFVQADTEDTHARNFYKKNGAMEIDVRHYDFEIQP